VSVVRWLGDLDPYLATTSIGPKLGRLAELAAAGFDTPRGFAVTAAACAVHELDSGLADALRTRLRAVTDPADRTEIAAAAADLQARYLSCPVAPTLAEEVVAAYGQLADLLDVLDPPVAVRSSALGEDAREASFAGVFDTHLGIRTGGDVVDAVRACWASRFSVRALAYQLRRPWSPPQWMPMAVGVLELVEAQASGVGFSVHPTTGARDRLVIEATFGWGEAVVQGLVTPDRVEVDATDGRVLRYVVADKAVISALRPGSWEVVAQPMPADLRCARALDPSRVADVASVVTGIDRHYGHPVDVEWVIDAADTARPVVVVQARPVTATATDADIAWDPVDCAMRYAFGAEHGQGWSR
jgi:pyruvate,water dikinase